MQFWEMSFYSDVQLQIRNLYLSHEDSTHELSAGTDSLSTSSSDTVTQQSSLEQNGNGSVHEKTALEIAAEQVRASGKGEVFSLHRPRDV